MRQSGLEPKLLGLALVRSAQINGCPYSLSLQTTEARARHERAERLRRLERWREAAGFNRRERAALEWTEAVTRIVGSDVPDSVYSLAQKHFTEAELAKLTVAVALANAWDRIGIALRLPPEAACFA